MKRSISVHVYVNIVDNYLRFAYTWNTDIDCSSWPVFAHRSKIFNDETHPVEVKIKSLPSDCSKRRLHFERFHRFK